MRSSKWKIEMNKRFAAPGEVLYVLQGEDIGLKKYGSSRREQNLLHYHLLMEIGVCRAGTGRLLLHTDELKYHGDMVSIIPPHFPHTTFSTEGTLSFWEYIFIDVGKVLEHIYPSDILTRRQKYEEICSKSYFLDTGKITGLHSIITLIFDQTRQDRSKCPELLLSLASSLLLLIARMNESGPGMPRKDKVCTNEPGQEGSGGIPVVSTADRSLSTMPSEFACEPVSAMTLCNDYWKIRPSLKYIQDCYYEEIHVADLANLCSLSESHFRKIFREIVGMSPIDYLNDYRIYTACNLLEQTDQTITETAVSCGYDTVSTFIRNFRRVKGTSPAKWRKTIRNYHNRQNH